MNYAENVKRNLEHLQTPATDWQAVELKAMVADKESGQVMPEFVFPSGYSPAPSLYRSGNAGDMCCELCAHPIKNAYYIQNDRKRWVMMVGSECVTHFAHASGQQLSKEAQWEANREYLHQVILFKNNLLDRQSVVHMGSYGRRNRYWRDNQARLDFNRLCDLLEGKQAYVPEYISKKPTSNGVITGWINRNKAEVDEIMGRWQN